MDEKNIKEDLIQYVWNSRLLSGKILQTTTGQLLQIIHPGIWNIHQGPDFLMAKVKIDEVVWVGHIEIHVFSSDWVLHGHKGDERYENVILHVVYKNDSKQNFPADQSYCLELKELLSPDLLIQYEALKNTAYKLPCAEWIQKVPEHIKNNQLDRMLAERWENRAAKIKSHLGNNYDWEHLLWQYIAHYMVTPANSDAMEMLFGKLDFSIIRRLANREFEMEALLFGTAGFLNDEEGDEYYLKLLNEFKYQERKFGIQKMAVHIWKFLRMRPQHFPTLRLAQLSGMMSHSIPLFDQILQAQDTSEVRRFLQQPVSDFWCDHFHFKDSAHPKKIKHIGKQMQDLLLINAVCPVLYYYGQVMNKTELCDKAFRWIQTIPAEQNSILKLYSSESWLAHHAGDSQAMLQLNKQYCSLKKCLQCQIGNYVLQYKLE